MLSLEEPLESAVEFLRGDVRVQLCTIAHRKPKLRADFEAQINSWREKINWLIEGSHSKGRLFAFEVGLVVVFHKMTLIDAT